MSMIYNYAGCRVEMIVADNCGDFENGLNQYLEDAYSKGLLVHDIQYQHSRGMYSSIYSALVIYST